MKGCHTCKWDHGGYCESPDGGVGCNWIGEMFRGEPNSWASWEMKATTTLRCNAKNSDDELIDVVQKLRSEILSLSLRIQSNNPQ